MDLHTQGSHLGAPPVSGPHPLHLQRTESSPPEQTVIRTAEFPLAEANQTLLLELGLQKPRKWLRYPGTCLLPAS